MKSRTQKTGGLNVASLAAAALRVQEPPANERLAFFVRVEGARCAAYLVWKAKRTIRRTGHADFHAERDGVEKPLPFWVRVGIEHLRKRAGWNVVAYTHQGRRHTRVVWQRHGDQWPESIALRCKASLS